MGLRLLSAAFLLICLLVPPMATVAAPWIGQTVNGTPCTGGSQGVGPFDYTNPVHRNSKLNAVESHHFHAEIEQLTGLPDKFLKNEIDYTLRAFPNHHRALQAMARLQTKGKAIGDRIPSTRTPVECYFERAINFAPSDGTVQVLYAIYLHKLGRNAIALQKYQSAEKLEPNSTALHYNLALLYIDLKKYKQARLHAIKAYRGGYPLLGLKNKLAKLGFWKNGVDG